MKTALKLVAISAAAALLGGCVIQTLSPLFAEKDLARYSDILGTWTQDDNVGVWTFSTDGNRYKLVQRDEKKRVATFHASVGKLGSDVFMDCTLDDLEDRLNDVAALHLIPAHTFCKLVKRDTNLVLVAMDVDWLSGKLKDNPKLIPHVMQQDRPVLTASTAELQQFVQKFAGDTNAFKNEIVLKR